MKEDIKKPEEWEELNSKKIELISEESSTEDGIFDDLDLPEKLKEILWTNISPEEVFLTATFFNRENKTILNILCNLKDVFKLNITTSDISRLSNKAYTEKTITNAR